MLQQDSSRIGLKAFQDSAYKSEQKKETTSTEQQSISILKKSSTRGEERNSNKKSVSFELHDT